MVSIPTATPRTMPVPPITAKEVLTLLQVPPVADEESVIVLPTATVDGPDMVPGFGIDNTVTTLAPVPVSPQVLRLEHFTVSIPAAIPVTTPEDESEATDGLVCDHVQPVGPVNVTELAGQIGAPDPPIDGIAGPRMVTGHFADMAPHPLIIV